MPRIDTQVPSSAIDTLKEKKKSSRAINNTFSALVRKIIARDDGRSRSLENLKSLLSSSEVAEGVKIQGVEKAIFADDDKLLSIIHEFGGGIDEPLDDVIAQAKGPECGLAMTFLEKNGIVPKPVGLTKELRADSSLMTRKEFTKLWEQEKPPMVTLYA